MNPLIKSWMENMSASKRTTIAGIAIFITGGIQLLMSSGIELPDEVHQVMGILLLIAGAFATQGRDGDKSSQDHHIRKEPPKSSPE